MPKKIIRRSEKSLGKWGKTLNNLAFIVWLTKKLSFLNKVALMLCGRKKKLWEKLTDYVRRSLALLYNNVSGSHWDVEHFKQS